MFQPRRPDRRRFPRTSAPGDTHPCRPPFSTPRRPAVRLDHTAVLAADRQLSAEFLAAVLGLEVGAPYGPFLPVDLAGGVTLDYYEKRDEPIQPQHYAFLVPDEGFDGMIARLEALGVTYYADPAGHHMEIMTRPYVRP